MQVDQNESAFLWSETIMLFLLQWACPRHQMNLVKGSLVMAVERHSNTIHYMFSSHIYEDSKAL